MVGFVQVAWPGRRGYAARVSRLHCHRWAVVFLLVSKLILGELAHAMPHEAAAAMNEVVTSAHVVHGSPPCGEHVQTGGAESGQSQDSSADGHATKDCCKGSQCACPCLHSPAAAAAVPFVMQLTHDNQVAVLVDGADCHRLSALFRPPA